MTRAVLSLGGNLGDREAHLRTAMAGLIAELRATEVPAAVRVPAMDAGGVLAVSRVYSTPPWGDDDQPWYLNAVVLAARAGAPAEYWLELARRLEAAAARRRDPDRPFGPRTLDVDVIAAWTDDGAAIVRDDPALTLPHPRAHLRAFVLRPWLEVEPHAVLPGHGSVHELLRAPTVADDLARMRAHPDLTLEG